MTNQHIPSAVLRAAAEAVGTDRPNTHGDAIVNHGCIAILWNAYITAKTYAGGGQIDTMRLLGAADAAQMMVLFKVARTISGDPTHPDHYVDQAGYTALAARMWGADPSPLRPDEMETFETPIPADDPHYGEGANQPAADDTAGLDDGA